MEWTSITAWVGGGVDFNNGGLGVEWTSITAWVGVEWTSTTAWGGGGVDFNNGVGGGWSGLQ